MMFQVRRSGENVISQNNSIRQGMIRNAINEYLVDFGIFRLLSLAPVAYSLKSASIPL